MWNQTNTQAAQFQHTLKCKRELSYLKLSKCFQKGLRGASVSSPVMQVQLAWWNTMIVATGKWWVAAKRPSKRRERDASRPALFPFAKHPRERREICGKPGVCSAEMLPPPLPPTPVVSAGFTSQLQLPTAVWEMDRGLGKQQ